MSSSVENTPKNFEKVETSVLEATDNRRQEHELFLAGKNGKLTARHIRITTKSGHGPFIAVYSIKVLGEVGAGQGKKTSKPKDGGKEAAGFNFAGSTGSKFGTAFSTQPIQPDSGGFGGFQTTARERVPSPPIPTVQARFQELDSVPAQGTAGVWAGEPEMGRDEVMVFDRDEDD